jgi:preprotein translocase subunit SecG
MFGILLILHIAISIGLIIVILLQSSKGEGLAGAFGGSGITGAVFGGRGAATFLSKATSVTAIAFFLSCLALTTLFPGGAGSGSGTVQREAQKALQQQQVPLDEQTGQPVSGEPPAQQNEGGSVLPPVPESAKNGN